MAYETDRLGFLTEIVQYGELASFDRRTTVVNSPALMRGVLAADDHFGVNRDFLQRPLPPGEQVKRVAIRKALNPGMRPSAVTSAAELVTLNASAALAPLASNGSWFDPLPVTESVISKSVAQFYFGEDAYELGSAVPDLLDQLSNVIGNPFAPPSSWRTPTRKRINGHHRELLATVTSLLHRRSVSRYPDSDFAAGVLARATDEGHSLEAIAELLIGSLLAAQRVPAAAASWMLMLVADHPHWQAILADEVRETTATEQSVSHIRPATGHSMAVVLETLRLFPPTWLIARTVTRDVELGGYGFGRGHSLMLSPFVLHRQESNFQDAQDFNPTRWISRAPQGFFLPFGRGLHGCPGSDLSVTMLIALLQEAVTRFAVERDQGSVVRMNPRTTLAPRNLRLRLLRTTEHDRRAAIGQARRVSQGLGTA